MPLLRKSQFEKVPIPADLRADEEIFHCSLTGEIFRDYDEFFKRTILLNSLVWTCSSTGKSGLTYEEALTSERAVQESLEKLPDHLERPILYVASLTVRGRLDDLVADVCNFMKERYFVGEVVEVVHSGVKRFGTIIEVNYDENANVETGSNEDHENGDDSNSRPESEGVLTIDLDNGLETTVSSSSANHSAFSSPFQNTPTSTSKKQQQRKLDEYGPPPEAFKYVVEVIRNKREEKRGSSPADRCTDAVKRMAVFTYDGIIRRKVALTKTRSRLLLKNVCELENNRYFIIKPSVRSEYGLNSIQWENLFAGPKPTFPRTPLTRKPYTRASSPPARQTPPQLRRESPSSALLHQQQLQLQLQEKRLMEEQEAKMILAWEKQQQIIAVLVAEAQRYDVNVNAAIVRSVRSPPGTLISETLISDLRDSLKKARDDEKERIREERRKAREMLIEWKKPRDDLECDDHKTLPEYTSIVVPSFVTSDDFGDCLSLLEFFRSFDDTLNVRETFANGVVTLEYVLEALRSRDPQQSSYVELCGFLLRQVFEKQAEEDGDEANLENKEELQQDNSDLDNRYFRAAIEEATVLSESVRNTHGASVRFLPVDGYTLTEVLRLYFLSGGYYTGVSTARFRFHRRGGFKCWDDQALLFRLKNPDVMSALTKTSVFELTPTDKLRILTVLRDQLLTFSSLRTPLQEKTERLWALRYQWRQIVLLELKWDKECTSAKIALQNASSTSNAGENESTTPKRNVSNSAEKTSEIYEAVTKCFTKDAGDRDKLKSTLENVNFDRLASVREIDDVRRMQKEFFSSEENRYKREIRQLQTSCGLSLLGQDRAFRKYWLVASLPALMIEGKDSTSDLIFCEHPTPVDKVEPPPTTSLDVHELRRRLYVCTGVVDNCPVHASPSNQRWFVLYDENRLDQLIGGLNRRGYREMELAEQLTFYKDFLASNVFTKRDDIQFLIGDGGKFESEYDVDVAESLESAFRDSLLEMEEKIHDGGLGSLKVSNRDKWRDAVENFRYDPQAEFVYLNVDDKIVLTNELSSSSSSNPNVNTMRLALLQVADGINCKFLKRPFSADDSNSTTYAQADDDQRTPLILVDTFYLWKKSLLRAVSWSQLHLHLATFERAVTWQKSLLSVRCRQCRRKGDAKSLTVCALCDRPFHLACVKPSQRKPAAGATAWTCSDCRRQTKTEKKTLDWRQNSEIFDSEFSTASNEKDEPAKCASCKKRFNKKGRLTCVSCANSYHFDCASTKTAGRTSWRCNSCLTSADSSNRSSDCDEATTNSHHSTAAAAVKISRTGRTVKRPISFEELDFDKKHSSLKHHATNGFDDDDEADATTTIVEQPRKKKIRKSDTVVENFETPTTTTNSARCSSERNERRGEIGRFNQLLKLATRHTDAWPFLKPVNRKDAPDYYTYITKPIDLQTMRTKLDCGKYKNERQFVEDFRQMFENCRVYNEPYCPVSRCGENLEKFVQEKMIQMKFSVTLRQISSSSAGGNVNNSMKSSPVKQETTRTKNNVEDEDDDDDGEEAE